MMLDNKNEQKWPLTEKEVLKKNKQSRVISFVFAAGPGGIFLYPGRKKEQAAHRPPNIFIIPYPKTEVNI